MNRRVIAAIVAGAVLGGVAPATLAAAGPSAMAETTATPAPRPAPEAAPGAAPSDPAPTPSYGRAPATSETPAGNAPATSETPAGNADPSGSPPPEGTPSATPSGTPLPEGSPGSTPDPAQDAPVLANASTLPTAVETPATVVLRVNATSTSPGGIQAVSVTLTSPDEPARRLEMSRVNGTVHSGAYQAVTQIEKVAADTSFQPVFEALDTNGKTATAEGTAVKVKRGPAYPITSVTVPRYVTLSEYGANVRVEAHVENGPDRVQLTRDQVALPFTHIGAGEYRLMVPLPVNAPTGLHSYTIEALNPAGVADGTRPVEFHVKRAVRFSGFDAGPEPVAKGQKLTASGHLYGLSPDGTEFRPMAWHYVDIMFKEAGSSAYTTLARVKADAQGRFFGAFFAASDGDWKAAFAGTASYAQMTSHADFVDVK
ncbi:hypothetical protein [Bailinhaonella thermotolerans]|uniref:Uncharacterized protein n=1 Tax=Bailinhaonella thermotolerans TaxID=1070861 RepID=A0A3A4AEJ6_9ACTN|nr:hypothetical protein [Bailinhaonella thermotolerans]RJL24460.1 hypothetical protein D5H75_29500 [Bailinhaonella thermotolerans]